jgi:hypothetical protein
MRNRPASHDDERDGPAGRWMDRHPGRLDESRSGRPVLADDGGGGARPGTQACTRSPPVLDQRRPERTEAGCKRPRCCPDMRRPGPDRIWGEVLGACSPRDHVLQIDHSTRCVVDDQVESGSSRPSAAQVGRSKCATPAAARPGFGASRTPLTRRDRSERRCVAAAAERTTAVVTRPGRSYPVA